MMCNKSDKRIGENSVVIYLSLNLRFVENKIFYYLIFFCYNKIK